MLNNPTNSVHHVNDITKNPLNLELMKAVEQDNLKQVITLLAEDVDRLAIITALALACAKENLEVIYPIIMALKKNYEENIKTKEYTALVYTLGIAAKIGNTKIIQLLLNEFFNTINLPSQVLGQAYRYAYDKKNMEAADFFITKYSSAIEQFFPELIKTNRGAARYFLVNAPRFSTEQPLQQALDYLNELKSELTTEEAEEFIELITIYINYMKYPRSSSNVPYNISLDAIKTDCANVNDETICTTIDISKNNYVNNAPSDFERLYKAAQDRDFEVVKEEITKHKENLNAEILGETFCRAYEVGSDDEEEDIEDFLLDEYYYEIAKFFPHMPERGYYSSTIYWLQNATRAFITTETIQEAEKLLNNRILFECKRKPELLNDYCKNSKEIENIDAFLKNSQEILESFDTYLQRDRNNNKSAKHPVPPESELGLERGSKTDDPSTVEDELANVMNQELMAKLDRIKTETEATALELKRAGIEQKQIDDYVAKQMLTANLIYNEKIIKPNVKRETLSESPKEKAIREIRERRNMEMGNYAKICRENGMSEEDISVALTAMFGITMQRQAGP